MHSMKDHTRSAEALALPILPNILPALNEWLTACEEANVLFCSPHVLLALLELPESEVAQCFDEAQPGFSEEFRAQLRRGWEHVSRRENPNGHQVFRKVNLNGQDEVFRAKHFAWYDGQPAVDDLYLFLGFLDNERSGTRRYLLAKLGEETFNSLRETTSERAVGRDLRPLLAPRDTTL